MRHPPRALPPRAGADARQAPPPAHSCSGWSARQCGPPTRRPRDTTTGPAAAARQSWGARRQGAPRGLLGAACQRPRCCPRAACPGLLRQGGAAKRAVVAFRGACFNSEDHRCRRDFCAGWLANGGSYVWAALSDWKALYGALYCRWTWAAARASDRVDYLAAAVRAAGAAEAALPGHALLLTGHSLGGLLALLAAAEVGLPAVALAPPGAARAAAAHGLEFGGSAGLWSVFHAWDPVYQDVLDAGPAGLEVRRRDPHTSAAAGQAHAGPRSCACTPGLALRGGACTALPGPSMWLASGASGGVETCRSCRHVSDTKKRCRLRRHLRVSCPRMLAWKRLRLQQSVSRWRLAQAAAQGRCAISRKTLF
ncbi:unnamed protein product [Prorocentrum cordatum]|uniref:Fungal lipase-like domain-containing protein n=1 Tax=Prorocentrum cordatum TaxID=2364126 RepID=A0ABN9RCW4_9DINO|nr:unnamed protein product [Polarella glacialis]